MMLRKFTMFVLCGLVLGLQAQRVVLAQGKNSNESSTESEEKILSPSQLQEDLAFIKNRIATVHPEIAYTADQPQLDRVYRDLEAAFQKPMSKDAAWRELARLNPYFADGHVSVTFIDRHKEARAHLATGKGFFPFEVYVDGDANLFVTSELAGAQSEFKGSRIEKINGVSTKTIVKELLARVPGDTPALQANLLSDRFWSIFQKMYGSPDNFSMLLNHNGVEKQIQRNAARNLPKSVALDQEFKYQFQFEILNKQTALLTLRTFVWEHDEKAFKEFVKQVFQKMSEGQISQLIIDIRENTGGNDSMWKEILRYIADKAYRNGSTYRKRVLAGRQSGTEKVGDIVDGTVDSWVQPEVNNAYFFKGKTYLLVGRTTYSSSVLFSNVMQDFGFGQLVGQAGYARARQTGGINQVNILPNTGLQIVLPRFIVDRPSGKRDPILINPDLVLPDSPCDDRALVHTLVEKLGLK